MEVECCYTVAVSAWCSMHQLPGCKCTGKSLQAPFRYVSGGFWAVILTHPAQARGWASVWPRSKHVVADKVCALNRWYGAGPAYDSLDHRAGM